jgi:hypothetical protein
LVTYRAILSPDEWIRKVEALFGFSWRQPMIDFVIGLLFLWAWGQTAKAGSTS